MLRVEQNLPPSPALTMRMLSQEVAQESLGHAQQPRRPVQPDRLDSLRPCRERGHGCPSIASVAIWRI